MKLQHRHQGALSIIRYAPIPERDEHFAVGLLMICEDLGWAKVKFSDARIRRLNRAFGVSTSALLDTLMESQTEQPPKIQSELSYLSRYENGMIRYDAPKPIVTDNFEETFEQLYQKWIADELEQEAIEPKRGEQRGAAFRRLAKQNEVLSSRLNINYTLKQETLGVPLLVPSQRLDFIGGNGSLYLGKFISLSLKEETVEENLTETFHLIQSLQFLFEVKFKPSDSKIILDREEVARFEKPRNLISLWKENIGFNVVEIDSTESLLKEVEQEVIHKNVKPFETWITREENKPKWKPSLSLPHAEKKLHSRQHRGQHGFACVQDAVSESRIARYRHRLL